MFYSGEFMIETTNVIMPGRVIMADVRWRGMAFQFVNVYAPSKLWEREGFLDNLTHWGEWFPQWRECCRWQLVSTGSFSAVGVL